MNCQNIRAAIDTASRRDPVSESVLSHVGTCSDCSRYSDETTALLSLIAAQPRVQAPADFDFKLRARIARAQSEPRGIVAAIESLWAKNFSWGQAAAAMATIAMAVTFGTVYFTQMEREMTGPQDIAVAEAPVKVTVDTANDVAEQTVTTAPVVEQAPAPARFTSGSAVSSSVEATPLEISEPRVDLASSSDTMRIYNRERGQIIAASNRTTLIGAENPSAGLVKTAAYVPSI